MGLRILIANELPQDCATLVRLLRNSAEVVVASNSTEARQMGICRIDAVLLCVRTDIPAEWREFIASEAIRAAGIPVILLANDSGEELAITALRCGIREYLKLPLLDDVLVQSILACANVTRRPGPDRGRFPVQSRLKGECASMRRLREYVAMVGQSDCSVLVTGETGTGKELVAESIHEASARSGSPFVCMNCAAIPETLLESELFGYERGAFTGANAARDGKMRHADGGTLFLDELGELSLCAQAKILRAVETKEIQRLGGTGTVPTNFRVIAATNQNLESLVENKLFRQDLYFRLNVARIRLPPLRERREDVPGLLEFYLDEFNRKTGQRVEGFSSAALEMLCLYAWPGNIRELRNTVEAILIVRPLPRVELYHLPDHIACAVSPGATAGVSRDERAYLVDTLRLTNWNKSKTARALKWSRMTLYRKMSKYGLAAAEHTRVAENARVAEDTRVDVARTHKAATAKRAAS